MDFITAGGILVCIALLWVFSVLMLKLLYTLQERLEEICESPVEQRCQHCQEKNDCMAYDTGVCYPCRHYKEDDNAYPHRTRSPMPGVPTVRCQEEDDDGTEK